MEQRPIPYGLLPDWAILRHIGITNYAAGLKRQGTISYGLSSFGYDARLSDKFKVFTNVHGAIVDPKEMGRRAFVDVSGAYCVIPPNSYVLGETVEHFAIPDDTLALCIGKSTYARAGIIVNATPLEPGWRGWVTVEISNATPLPCKVYAFEGIMQVLFLRSQTPEVTYDDKRGKYQDQAGLVLPRVD